MATANGPLLGHMVYFTLHDNSAAKVQELLDGCNKYLTGHPGVVFFAAGTRAAEYARPVNDKEFDVAIQLVFQSREAHDAYQVHPRHKQFMEENRANWKQARVFDADVSC